MDNIRDIIDDLDDDFLESLVEDIGLEISNVERYLMNYHQFFADSNHINRILGSARHINLISQQTFLEPLHAYTQILEDFFNAACSGTFGQSQWLSELMLLLVDEVRSCFEDLLLRHTLDVLLLDELKNQLKELLEHKGIDAAESIKSVITAFSCRVHPDLVFSAFEPEQLMPTTLNCEIAMVNEKRDSSNIFEDLAESLDSRSPLWEGRTRRILEYCKLINNAIHGEVDPSQLMAAVYMHDVGMALLSDAVLFKAGRYDSIEVMLLQQHPTQVYELLKQMPDWQEAAIMVQQHHEHFDGKGYPNGIAGNDLHTGAKIIAIADTFYSLTHDRTDRGFKKSLSRSLAEINKYNGTQFDPRLVEVFNLALIDFVNQSH